MNEEMLPIFVGGINGFYLKPLLQALFEQPLPLRPQEVLLRLSRGERSIENHFTQDWGIVRALNEGGKS
jgi:UTP-glucose-1-phosphate uridylyltransferase